MKLSIIIINYRSITLLKRLLETLAPFHKNIEYEVLLVNNWPPEQKEILQLISDVPHSRLITPPHNLYFAPSINMAAVQAHGQYLVFLNVDTYFTQPTLQNMSRYLDTHPEYAVVVGTIRDHTTNTISKSTNELPTFATELIRNTLITKFLSWIHWFPKWYKKYIYFSWDRTTDQDIAAGCDAFMMIRSDFFNKTGGYSPGLLMYLTEEDIGRKLRQFNLKIRYLAHSIIFHDWSHSSKQVTRAKIQAIAVWDRYIYFSRHYSTPVVWFLCILTILLNPYMLVRFPLLLIWIYKISNESNRIKKLLNTFSYV